MSKIIYTTPGGTNITQNVYGGVYSEIISGFGTTFPHGITIPPGALALPFIIAKNNPAALQLSNGFYLEITATDIIVVTLTGIAAPILIEYFWTVTIIAP